MIAADHSSVLVRFRIKESRQDPLLAKASYEDTAQGFPPLMWAFFLAIDLALIALN